MLKPWYVVTSNWQNKPHTEFKEEIVGGPHWSKVKALTVALWNQARTGDHVFIQRGNVIAKEWRVPPNV